MRCAFRSGRGLWEPWLTRVWNAMSAEAGRGAAGRFLFPSQVHLQGLMDATTYHWKVVADDGKGGYPDKRCMEFHDAIKHRSWVVFRE